MLEDRIIRAEDIEDSEPEEIRCPKCSAVGIRSILGPKILMPNKEPQPDYENWLMCARCAFLCPIYEAQPEVTIQDDVTTIENPFENAQGQVLGAKNSYNSKLKIFRYIDDMILISKICEQMLIY